MGVINQGILGGFSGKVGPVVGAKWKDIDYMRGYVIPANPNTTSQQAKRAKFSALVAAARKLLAVVLQPFWDPYYSTMSGFNAFISQNYSNASSTGILNENSILSKGTLFAPPTSDSNYDTATGYLEVNWDMSLSGDAQNTDGVCIVCYDESDQEFYFAVPATTRNTGTYVVTLPTGLTATNLSAFVFCFAGTGPAQKVSDSVGSATTAA